MPYLKTSDIARAVGVHPNTVRMYEELGFISPVPRTSKGYRMFSEDHLDQVLLVRTALRSTWLGGEIRRTALSAIRLTVSGDLAGALNQARVHLGLIQRERSRAEYAVRYLEEWATKACSKTTDKPLRISEAARLLDVTGDMLRNWERNGLVKVPRDPESGYRLYGNPEIGRLSVIRSLRRARYSIMSIYRMFHRFDRGEKVNLRQVLDSVPPDEEDVFFNTDRWLTKLGEIEKYAGEMIARLQNIIQKKQKQSS